MRLLVLSLKSLCGLYVATFIELIILTEFANRLIFTFFVFLSISYNVQSYEPSCHVAYVAYTSQSWTASTHIASHTGLPEPPALLTNAVISIPYNNVWYPVCTTKVLVEKRTLEFDGLEQQ